jgi:hypothetical protein
MTCPTCFQKIIVPQAPSTDEQKLILTGIKVGDRPAMRDPELNPYANPEPKRVSGVIVVLAILLLIGLAVGFVYQGTILQPILKGKTGAPPASTNGTTSQSNGINPGPATDPAAVPPMADDTNYLLNLAGVKIPDSTAAGRIHGEDFLTERAVYARGSLTLRTGRKGPVNFGVSINFNGAEAEALAGKNLNIVADTNKSALVTLHWPEDGETHETHKDSYEINYALRLEFGSLTNRHLPGRIYLCTPDPQKSYVMGTFNAEVSVPRYQP